MSEAGNQTASQPASAAAQPVTSSAPAQPQSPAIDPGEFARYQRDSQHLAGIKKQLDELGFKDLSKLAAYKPVFERVKDPSAFTRAYDGEPEQPSRGLDEASLSALLDKREAAKALAEAEKAHWAALDADEAYFSDAKIDEAFGKDTPKELKALIKSALKGDYHSARPDYEEGHPLHGKRPKPLGGEWFGKQLPTYKAHAEALKKHWQAASLAAIGDAANKNTPGTPAGQNSGNGPPQNTKERGGLPSQAEGLAALQAIRAKRRAG